jgi:hypothetical protein
VNYSFNLHYLLGEINNQTMFLAQRFKIRLYDCEVHISNTSRCLEFNDDSIIYDEIEPMSSYLDTIIVDDNFTLSRHLKIFFLQLYDKGILVNRSQKARAQPFVNLNRTLYDPFC